jgi:hypothetical protein
MSDDLPVLKVIPPMPIGTAQLLASNVPEVPPAAWSSATTYALGDQATIFSGLSNTTATVYQSLQAGNLNHAPASSPTWWKRIGETYAVFVVGGPGGAGYSIARVIDPTTHLVYQSLVVSNTAPLEDAASWALVGPTNKYAMFDGTNSTESIAAVPIVVQVQPYGRADSVALFNLTASSVRIQTDAGYDKTYNLADNGWIDDYYDWFFAPLTHMDQLVVTDLPPYLDPIVTVTITNNATIGVTDVKAGNLVFGQQRSLGMPVAEASSGRLTYSKIDVNEWGDYTLTKRKSVKKASCTIIVDNDRVDFTSQLMEDFDATPIVWMISGQFRATQLFGIYRNFSCVFSWPDQSAFQLDLEGIT